jgi:hypothetical protein
MGVVIRILAPVRPALPRRLPCRISLTPRHSYRQHCYMHDYELDSLTTVAHEAGLRYNIAMHRVAMLRPASCTRSEMYPNAMAQPLDDALSKCVLRPGALGWLQLKLARTRPGALSTDRCCACNHHGPKYHHLICSWATLLSACRPADPASTRHLMTQTTCAARQPFPLHWPIQLQLFSVTIEIDLAGRLVLCL